MSGPQPAGSTEYYLADIDALREENLRMRRSEEALFAQRDWIASTLKSVFGFVFFFSHDYQARMMDASVPEHFNAAPGACRCYEILRHRTVPCESCPAMNVLTTGLASSWEETLIDGHTYKVSGHPYPMGDTCTVVVAGIDVTDHKKVDDALQLNEQKYRALIDAIPDTIFIVDRDCLITSFKPGPHFHHDTQSIPVTGRNLKDIIPRKAAKIFVSKVQEAFDTGKGQYYEYELRSLNRFEEARFTLCNRDEVMIIVRDISERKHAEIKLLKNEVSLERGQRIAHLGTWEFEVRANTFTGSEEAYNIFGITPKAYTVDDLLRTIHPDDLRRFRDTFWAPADNSGVGSIDFRIRRPDGEVRVVHGEGNFTFDADGRPITIFGTIQDITERKQIEDALRESDGRFRAMADTTSGGIFICQDERYVYANPGATALTGYSEAELAAGKFWDIVHPDHRELVKERARARIQNEIVVSRYPLRFINKAGETRWAEIDVGLIIYLSRPALIVTAFDITEHIRAKETALASLKEKELLLKEIHHRVKNNLQIITSLLSLQSAVIKDPVTISAFVNSQHRIRSMALIHEMLYRSGDFSRVEFTEYARSLSGGLLRSAHSGYGRIAFDIDAGPVYLDIEHAIPCGLILSELVGNSIKHAFHNKPAGTISIRLRQDEGSGQFTLSIGDDGDGLPPDLDMASLTTLGLELVVTLVGQLDGSLELDRAGGTKFTITF